MTKTASIAIIIALCCATFVSAQTIEIAPGEEHENFYSKTISFQPSSVSVKYLGEDEAHLTIKSLVFLSFVQIGTSYLSGARFWLVAAAETQPGSYNGEFEVVFRRSSQRDTLIKNITINVTVTSVSSNIASPESFRLEQNYPNPFNPTTTIRYQLSAASNVQLVLYDLLGQKVVTLVDGTQQAGVYTVQWNGKTDSGQEAASGVYLYKLTTGGFAQVRKLTLLR